MISRIFPKIKKLLTSYKVGFYLGIKDILRASIWTTALITFVMTLTFMNLIVVRGILIGLIEGSISANKDRFSGDVILSILKDKEYIENSSEIISYLNSHPLISKVSYHYVENGKIESGYKTKIEDGDLPDYIGAQISGIDPEKEDQVTQLSKYIIEGRYLNSTDEDQVLVGSSLLYKYTKVDIAGAAPLKDVDVGDKIRLTVAGHTLEVTIKGILKGKVDEIDRRVIMPERQLRQLIDRNDLNVDEITIKAKPGATSEEIKTAILNQGYDKFAVVQTSFEAVPKFVKDISLTFSILGDVIGTIGLVVATITIFIVIFVNAITRRKYIGILKGIGINTIAIETSYVIQALFYAVTGILIGALIILYIIKPYFISHPLDFPFSDGIMVATIRDLFERAFLLIVATGFAGYVPARMVVKQNTLDAILGR